MANISGSFVRANWSGRAVSPFTTDRERITDSGSAAYGSATRDYVGEFLTSSYYPILRNRTGEPKSVGYAQGLAFGSPTSLDGGGSFGRHMQVGINKDTTIGNPAAPSLRMDYPGMWRFRWVVKQGRRSVSVYAMQNSSGSYRPSMVIKANPNVGLTADLMERATYVPGWTTIGPLYFTSTGTDVVWVELHNNNYAEPSVFQEPESMATPCYFDHIVTT